MGEPANETSTAFTTTFSSESTSNVTSDLRLIDSAQVSSKGLLERMSWAPSPRFGKWRPLPLPQTWQTEQIDHARTPPGLGLGLLGGGGAGGYSMWAAPAPAPAPPIQRAAADRGGGVNGGGAFGGGGQGGGGGAFGSSSFFGSAGDIADEDALEPEHRRGPSAELDAEWEKNNAGLLDDLGLD